MAHAQTGVCVIGSANLDVVATVARLPRPGETLLGSAYREYAGGKGLNQAVAAARSGAVTSFVGSIGDDEAGATLRQVLLDDGVDVSHVATAGEPTGRAVIFVDKAGENVIVVVPGANASTAPIRSIPEAGVLLAQLEIPIEAVIAACRHARRAGVTTLLNPAPADQLPDELIRACDIVVPNQHEIDILGGVDLLLDRGVATVIVTRGGDGVDVHTATESWHQAPFPVDVVDTTGAGDAFCGALAARLANGHPLPAAVRWAAAAGALATTVAGAVPAQPRAAQIEALLATPPV